MSDNDRQDEITADGAGRSGERAASEAGWLVSTVRGADAAAEGDGSRD